MTLKTLITGLLLFISASLSAFSTDEVRGEVPSKYKNLFVYKTDKEFIGAKVEILSATGRVITSQSLQKRKMVIDFGDVKFGTYTIRISKGDSVKEFQYVKK